MEPVLDPEAMQKALEAVRLAQPLPLPHPLHSFLLMHQQVGRPERLAGAHAWLYGLHEVLEACFLDVLGAERKTAADQLACLRQDFQSENEYRRAYSLLYYRYLRPELDLTVESIASVVGLVDRTLRRRQQDGLEHLTQDLIRREVQARRRRREETLRARLPLPDGRSLYGREWLVERALEALAARLPVLLLASRAWAKPLLP